MQTTITNFKAKCIHFVDTVQHQGDVVVITRHGKAAAKLVPIDDETDTPPFGVGAGTVQEIGDIYSTGETWDVESE
ncbi:type II toxin-antitoxin system Phd/YefM family antitoxin [Kiritimatiellaeota bacterium B1221]|nr:type II toxin-antitoxin system Phd/YefM family antitoxin [Kiritimatiellaeota bacterium B1221]